LGSREGLNKFDLNLIISKLVSGRIPPPLSLRIMIFGSFLKSPKTGFGLEENGELQR
jgi:hypothetical protein